MYEDVVLAKTQIYNYAGLAVSKYHQQKDSEDYHACSYQLNEYKLISRKAKITPTKTGQFVTLWKRLGDGLIAPIDQSAEVDIVVIAVRNGKQGGQFVFPKKVLVQNGIFSSDSRAGKRGFRVYPPWDKPNSKQAKDTQSWQSLYFLFLDESEPLDLSRAKLLYGLK